MEKTSDKCMRVGTIIFVIGIISSIVVGINSGKTLAFGWLRCRV